MLRIAQYRFGFNADVIPRHGNPNQWFDPAAFAQPAFEHSAILAVDGSGTWARQLGLSLSRTRGLPNVRLQFRAEVFNIMNHTNFGAPNLALFASNAPSPGGSDFKHYHHRAGTSV
jgi:hypothetical protein